MVRRLWITAPHAELRRFLIPMAIRLAFGLIFAAIVLPFLLPVMVWIVADIEEGIGRGWRMIKAGGERRGG